MAQVKEYIKTPEKELSNMEMDNLSDAEVKTLAIRMLTEMIGYWCKVEEEVKDMQSEIKKNIQGIKSEGKETGAQNNNLEQKEEINIQPEQKLKKLKIIIQKNEERLWNLQDNFRYSNIWIIGLT